MNALLAAIRLLTIIPVPLFGNGSEDNQPHRNSPAFFPVVGLLVGGVGALAFIAVDEILPVSVAAALAIAVSVALTGALHIDGLADSFDGLFGGRTRERKLEIMADPRIGAFGVGAIALLLLIKWAAISELVPQDNWSVLVVAPAISRGVVATVVLRFPYARSTGIGASYQNAGWWALPLAAILTLVVSLIFVGTTGLIALAVAATVGMGVAFYSLRAIGGVTGDIYGAVIELSELAALLTLVALLEADSDIGVIW